MSYLAYICIKQFRRLYSTLFYCKARRKLVGHEKSVRQMQDVVESFPYTSFVL